MFIKNKSIDKYNILKEFDAGIKLKGWEVKTLKIYKNIEIKNSYIVNIKNEIFLKNSLISKENIDLKIINRNRKILLKKNEIKNILKFIKQYKIIPINIYLKKKLIKIKIAIVLKKYNFLLKK